MQMHFRGDHKLIILAVVIVLSVVGSLIYFKIGGKNKTDKSKPPIEIAEPRENQQSATEQPKQQTSPVVPVTGPVSQTAGELFAKGLEYKQNLQLSQAIESFAAAINKDPKVASYYAEKAQTEIDMDRKEQAVKTLEAGLRNLPDSEGLSGMLANIKASL